MKALSIQQPWAWAIVHAGKDVENRTWRTKYRGRIYIHASSRPHQVWPDWAPEDLPHSAIIGMADLVDCVDKSDSKWFNGPIGFVLKNPQPIEPVFCKGKLGIWEVAPEIEKDVQKSWQRFNGEPSIGRMKREYELLMKK